MSANLVWLPFPPSELEETYPGLVLEEAHPPEDVPGSVAHVKYYVTPYMRGPAVADVVARMPQLEVIQALTAGVDDIYARVPAGVTLCNGKGIHDDSTAELTLALILGSLRGIPDFVRRQDARAWAPVVRPALADKRVLIVGYGAVGKAIEARLLPFQTEVVRVARTARDGVHGFDELPDLLPDADVVVISAPLTHETKAMVDARFLARMPDGALLVNVGRGAVVVTGDLAEALSSGRIHAAIDVVDQEPMPTDHPLWGLPNLLITPHVGGASGAMWPRAHRLVREQLRRYSTGSPLLNVMPSR